MRNRFLSYLIALSFFVFSILQVIDSSCFDYGFYTNFYHQNNTAASIGISNSDLDKMTETLLDYLKDERNDIDIDIRYQGSVVKGFNQREIDHMVDVKKMYLAVMTIKNIAFFSLIISFACFLIFNSSFRFDILYHGFSKIFIAIMGGALALSLYAFIDFDNFWTSFHLVFFTNDLWLLNPLTDRLIMMVPGNFFFALVSKIIIMTLSIWLMGFGLVYFLKRSFVK